MHSLNRSDFIGHIIENIIISSKVVDDLLSQSLNILLNIMNYVKKKSVSWEYIFFPLLCINSRLSTHGGLCIDNMTAFSHEHNIEVSNFFKNISSDNISFVLAFNLSINYI